MANKYAISIIIILVLAVVLLNLVHSTNTCIIDGTDNQEDVCFSVEIANTDEERRIGLSQTQSLDEDEGMLFIFNGPSLPRFWMKDMDFPLDIIWVNENLEIVEIDENLVPCMDVQCPTYSPSQRVKYVLEINSGLSEKYRISKGDRLKIK